MSIKPGPYHSPTRLKMKDFIVPELLAVCVPMEERDLWAMIDDDGPMTPAAAEALERLTGPPAKFWLYLDEQVRAWKPPWRRALERFWRKLTGKK